MAISREESRHLAALILEVLRLVRKGEYNQDTEGASDKVARIAGASSKTNEERRQNKCHVPYWDNNQKHILDL